MPAIDKPAGIDQRNKPAVKPTILFVHAVCPAQFSDLCEYLNATGLANAYYMTTPGNLERNKSTYRNLLPMTPDGNIMAGNAYYYSGKVERAGRLGIGLHRELLSLVKTHAIDLIVAHGSWGSPHLAFDEFDIPIITYIEFPSYADHGWDPLYPPTDAQRLVDKNMQMLSWYQVAKSALTIVPTEYARRLFPAFLRPRIVARFEGFDAGKVARREPSGIRLPGNTRTLGFAARDLSSAKGLDIFIATAAHLIRSGEDCHFVVIGDPNATTYSYEQPFLHRTYGKDSKITFLEHLLREHDIDRARFTVTGKLPYAQFSDLVHDIDLFMYPLKYGSGNWGLMELLLRGRAVVAADRCYVGEMIEHGYNGMLVQGSAPESWSAAVVALLHDEQKRIALGDHARTRATACSLPVAAASYMALFEDVITGYRSGRR